MYYNEVITFVVCDSESLSDNSQDITDSLAREIRRQKKRDHPPKRMVPLNGVKLKVRLLSLNRAQLET
ncbi:MAG: hypothetical protein CL909_03940 [Deltaproteobacteria bacterium]|nr:hypothetical protein [Deltaproteobacteria bacterium]